MSSDWEKGNAYEFQVVNEPGTRSKYVSNGKYGIIIRRADEAGMVCNLLNQVQIANGDGISKKILKKRLDDLIERYREMDKTFTETMIVENILKDVYEAIFND